MVTPQSDLGKALFTFLLHQSSRSLHGPEWLLELQPARLHSRQQKRGKRKDKVNTSQLSWNSGTTLIGCHLIQGLTWLQGRLRSVSKLSAALPQAGVCY